MRILIADRNAASRSALRILMVEEPAFELVGEAGDREQLLAQLEAVQPDLVLLDWDLAGNPVPDLLPNPAGLLQEPSVVVLCGRPEAEAAALASGAHAFFSKGDPPDRLLALIRRLRLEDQP